MKLFFTLLILLSSQLSQAASFNDLKAQNQPQRFENKSTQAQSHKPSEQQHLKQKKHKRKAEKHNRRPGHRGHYGNQKRHNRDYYNRGTRHHYHGNNYCEQDHYNSRHDSRHNGHNNGHYNDRNDNHYNSAVWREVTEFRTKNRRARDKHIPIHRQIAGLELEATKRSTYIHKAYIEYRNGNMRRIRSLEGHIDRGDPLIHHFRDPRHVVALHLEVSPGGHKRGYVRINAKNYH